MPGQILDANDTSYVYDDGAGNVAVVPKASLDPQSGTVQMWNASQAPQVQFGTPYNQGAPQMPAGPTSAPTLAPPSNANAAAPAPQTPDLARPSPEAGSQTAVAKNAPVAAPAKAPVTMTPQQMQGTALQTELAGVQQQSDIATQAGDLEAQRADEKAKILAQRNSDVAMQQRAADAQLQADRVAQQKVKESIARSAFAEDNFKVDRNAFYHNASTGKTIGMYVMAAIAGLGQVLDHKDPTKNPVLQMMDAENQKDVNAQLDQKEQLAKKTARLRGDLSDTQQGSRDRQAEFYKRMATLSEGAARQLEQAAAHFDSPQARLNAQQAQAGLKMKAAEYIDKAGDRQWQQEFQQKQMDQSAKQHAQTIGLGYANLAETRREHDLQAADKDAALNAKIAELTAKGDKSGADEMRKYGIDGIPGHQGPVMASVGSPEGIEKTRDKVSATNEIVGLMDELRRTRTGFTSATGNSEENQRLRTIQGQLKLKMKDAAQLGALSSSDIELIDSAIGFDDPTKWKSIEGGLMQARKNMIRSTAEELAKRGIKDYDIPDLQSQKAQSSPEDEDIKRVMRMPGKLEGGLAEAAQFYNTGDPSSKYYGRSVDAQGMQDMYNKNGGMAPSQLKTMRGLYADATSNDDKKRNAALENLLRISNDAESDAVKQTAAMYLANIATAQLNDVPLPKGR